MRSLLARSSFRGVASAIALAFCVAAPSAHAAAVTFNFGCSVIYSATPDACTGAGSFGSLTISDSTTNPGNAVDLVWNLTPGTGAGLNRILLNYEAPSAPSGLSFSVAGSVADYIANQWDTNVGEYGKFDMRIGFGAGSLAGMGTLTASSGGLSAAFFEASTAGGEPRLQALYRTSQGDGIYGAIPAPATLALVGLGLLAVGAGRRRLAKR
jgi:hypothetical protein